MFGFMKPEVESLDYRSVYSRLCQHQRRHYGLLSLPFHSYEAVFLYACALDAGLYPAGVVSPQRCCKLRQARGLADAPDADVGRFCASVAVLLADIKLQDDIRDGWGLLARLGRRLLGKRFAAANEYFLTLDPDFSRRVSEVIDQHLAGERAETPPDLREYVGPTAEAFGYVFGLLSRVREGGGDGEVFATIGRHVGAAVIAFDCATDWRADERTGDFNPVSTPAGEKAAARFCVDELTALAEVCDEGFGAGCRSGQLARSVARSVGRMFAVPVEGAMCVAAGGGDIRPGDTVLNFGCSMPVDHGSSGCCGCGRRAPSYVNLNQKETGCCCAAAGIGGLIVIGLAIASKAGGGAAAGGCK